MFKVTCLVDPERTVGSPRTTVPAQRYLSWSKHKQSINKIQLTCVIWMHRKKEEVIMRILAQESLDSRTWCPGLNHSVKLKALHRNVVPTGVTVLLGLCNPPCRGRGELAKPGLLYPLVWIPYYDTVSEKSGSRSRVGSIASDLESWITCGDRQD
jgi:hypothetical protein